MAEAYRVLVLHQVPQQSVALLADVVQVDVGHGVAAGVLVLVDRRTCGGQSDAFSSGSLTRKQSGPWVGLTLHQVLVVDGRQVGEVLLQV